MDMGDGQDVHKEYEEIYVNDISYNNTLLEDNSSENENFYI